MDEQLEKIRSDARKRDEAWKRAHNRERLTGNNDQLLALADEDNKEVLSKLKLDCQCSRCGALKYYFKTKSDIPKHIQDKILNMKCSDIKK